ncbi:Acetyltransferase [Vibrio stylophorae]|uniref:Acetyltransferase n=1 Tax=Vibrio stylophorae TaxID=659351 RepID=A0ABN8DSC9_9VIBR|nr:GNAT family N-acetyltransferase [Vibrio stylophorae]CAH0534009.1 Acetyltransferase [Vibrio stylophorae]
MIQILSATYQGQQRAHIRAVREHVFIEEQNIAPEIEFDALDANAFHVLAYDQARPVATGRMLSDGHIGRIAVEASHRHLGIGKQIIEALLTQAKAQGLARVFLGAQQSAIPFYQKLGFEPYGEPFMEANIVHQSMACTLK